MWADVLTLFPGFTSQLEHALLLSLPVSRSAYSLTLGLPGPTCDPYLAGDFSLRLSTYLWMPLSQDYYPELWLVLFLWPVE